MQNAPVDEPSIDSRPTYVLETCTILVISYSESYNDHVLYRRVRLQKPIGCFNHRVVTLVAEKLKRQWLCIVYFANCIRQPEWKLPDYLTTTILQM